MAPFLAPLAPLLAPFLGVCRRPWVPVWAIEADATSGRRIGGAGSERIVDPDVGINPQRQSDVAMSRQGLRHFRRDPGSLQAGNKQVSIGMEVGVAVLQEVGLLKLNAACSILLVTF